MSDLNAPVASRNNNKGWGKRPPHHFSDNLRNLLGGNWGGSTAWMRVRFHFPRENNKTDDDNKPLLPLLPSFWKRRPADSELTRRVPPSSSSYFFICDVWPHWHSTQLGPGSLLRDLTRRSTHFFFLFFRFLLRLTVESSFSIICCLFCLASNESKRAGRIEAGSPSSWHLEHSRASNYLRFVWATVKEEEEAEEGWVNLFNRPTPLKEMEGSQELKQK